MTRSLKKGVYVHESLKAKIDKLNANKEKKIFRNNSHKHNQKKKKKIRPYQSDWETHQIN